MGNPRILVVEKEGLSASQLQLRLRHLGYRISGVVPNGEEAVAMAGESRADLALVNIDAQHRGESFKAAGELNKRLKIPVVYLASEESDRMEDWKEQSELDFIPSPFQDKELRVAIESALQRHAMESKLKENQEWFFTTLRSIGDAVVASDEKGRVTFLNKSAEALTGWSQGEACGCLLGDVLQLENQITDVPENESFDAQRSQRFGVREVEVVSKDGDRTPVEAKSALIREKSGRVLGVVRILRDVTERKHADEVLRRSERRYRNLVEKSRDIIFTLSREGIITSLNPAFEIATGWSRRDWQYRPFSDLLNPGDALPVWEVFGKILRGEYVPPQEMRIRSKSDGEIMLECSCAPAGQDGRLGGVWGIARDITQRKRLEQRVLQTQKMDAVARVASGIAHDFNNLLTSINGYADFLSQELGKDHALSGNVRGILDSVDRAANLTKQLLAFGRQPAVQPRNLNPNTVIASMLPSLRGLVGENIEVSAAFAEHPGSLVFDPGQLERAILILVTNAREAMPQGGRLTLSTRVTSALPGDTDVTSDAKDFIVLSVEDTGCGMNEDVRGRLFEPFFTTKPIGKGTGLGLSTVYALMKQVGGDIHVESQLGKGSVFHLFFPRHEEPIAANQPISPAPETKAGSETILLVEDEEEVRLLLYTILKTNGYNVLKAKDGEEALEIANSRPGSINLVLTDLHMPKLGGRRLVETLIPANPGMKAMFMSGYGKEDFPEAHAHGLPVSFLEKPFMPKSLIRQIRKVLDG